MKWLLEDLLAILLNWLIGIMNILLSAFDSLSFDIGHTVEAVSGGGQYNAPHGKILDPIITRETSGLLDSIFPLEGLKTFFVAAGLLLAFGIAFAKLYQALVNPAAKSTESPGRVAGRLAISCIIVVYSYELFTVMQNAMESCYSTLKEVLGTTQSINMIEIFGSVTVQEGNVYFFKHEQDIFSQEGLKILMVFVFTCALFMALVKMVLELYERYIVFGLLFYTSPLAAGCIASEKTGEVFKKWVSMIVSLLILISLDTIVLSLFTKGMNTVFTIKPDGANMYYYFESISDYVVKMIILIGWLSVGTKLDQILRDMGVSVAQTGGALGAAIGAAITHVAHRVMSYGGRAAAKGAKIAGKGAKDLAKGDWNHTKALTGRLAEGTDPGKSPEKHTLANNPANRDAVTGNVKPDVQGKVLHNDPDVEGQRLEGKRDGENALAATRANVDNNEVLSDTFKDRNKDKTVAEDGMIETYDAEGQSQAQIGLASAYKTEDGSGTYVAGIDEDGAQYITPATQEIIDKDALAVAQWAEESKDITGAPEGAYYKPETTNDYSNVAEEDASATSPHYSGEKYDDGREHYTGNVIEYDKDGNPTGRVLANSSYDNFSQSQIQGETQQYAAEYVPGKNGKVAYESKSVSVFTASPDAEFDKSLVAKPKVSATAHNLERTSVVTTENASSTFNNSIGVGGNSNKEKSGGYSSSSGKQSGPRPAPSSSEGRRPAASQSAPPSQRRESSEAPKSKPSSSPASPRKIFGSRTDEARKKKKTPKKHN